MAIAAQHIRTGLNHLRAVDPAWRRIIKAVGPFQMKLERDPLRWIVDHCECHKFADFIQQRVSCSAKSSIMAAIVEQQQEPIGTLSPKQNEIEKLLSIAVESGEVNLTLPRSPEAFATQAPPLQRLLSEFGLPLWERFLFCCWGDLDSWPNQDKPFQAHAEQQWRNYGETPWSPTTIEAWAPFRSIAAWYLEQLPIRSLGESKPGLP